MARGIGLAVAGIAILLFDIALYMGGAGAAFLGVVGLILCFGAAAVLEMGCGARVGTRRTVTLFGGADDARLPMPRTLFLDLYGVIADPQIMDVRYNERMSDLLWRRFGGSPDAWREVQLASYAWYKDEGAKLDARPGSDREGDAWVEAVQRMNANQVRWMFERVGVPIPPKLLEYAESLEAETVRGIDALYPDTRPALAALKAAGHRLYLSTNANRSNGESALIGGGVRESFDGLAILETAKAKKDRPYYWRHAFELARTPPADAIVVDDEARYLVPAADLGARCYQVVRPGRNRELGPFPVIETLAALPDLVY